MTLHQMCVGYAVATVRGVSSVLLGFCVIQGMASPLVQACRFKPHRPLAPQCGPSCPRVLRRGENSAFPSARWGGTARSLSPAVGGHGALPSFLPGLFRHLRILGLGSTPLFDSVLTEGTLFPRGRDIWLRCLYCKPYSTSFARNTFLGFVTSLSPCYHP